MGVVRRVLLADQPTETTSSFLGVFGLVLAVIYWFVSYEVAGTVLLFRFGLACALGAARLLVVRRTLTGRRVAATADEPGPTGRSSTSAAGCRATRWRRCPWGWGSPCR